MSEIQSEIEAPPQNTDPDLARWLEENIGRMQQEIWQLRQFIEPMVKHNENAPDQEFSPLE